MQNGRSARTERSKTWILVVIAVVFVVVFVTAARHVYDEGMAKVQPYLEHQSDQRQ